MAPGKKRGKTVTSGRGEFPSGDTAQRMQVYKDTNAEVAANVVAICRGSRRKARCLCLATYCHSLLGGVKSPPSHAQLPRLTHRVKEARGRWHLIPNVTREKPHLQGRGVGGPEGSQAFGPGLSAVISRLHKRKRTPVPKRSSREETALGLSSRRV